MRKSILAAAALAVGLLPLTAATPARAQEPFLGQLMLVGYNFCPRGWANADGQLLPISQNTALFSLYGTMYGGDGRTTFGLPDLRGRVAMHTGNGPGLTPRREGQKGGSETNTLSVAQMPSHSHQLLAHSEVGEEFTPNGNVLASNGANIYSGEDSDAALRPDSIGNAGGNQPVNNVQPFQVLRWCVALQGIYPSRN